MLFSLVKEIIRLISKGTPNIYLKFTIEKNGRSASRSVFGELQLMQISLNFKIS